MENLGTKSGLGFAPHTTINPFLGLWKSQLLQVSQQAENGFFSDPFEKPSGVIGILIVIWN